MSVEAALVRLANLMSTTQLAIVCITLRVIAFVRMLPGIIAGLPALLDGIARYRKISLRIRYLSRSDRLD